MMSTQIKYVLASNCVSMPELGRSFYDNKHYFELKDAMSKGGWKPNYPASALFSTALNKWEIFVGVHRLKIAKEIGIKTIPIIETTVSREEAIAEGIKSNMMQGPYNVMDIASHLSALANPAHTREQKWSPHANSDHARDQDLSEREISKISGMSQPSVHHYLSLLKLPIEQQEMVGRNQLGMRHALELLKLGDHLKIAAMAEQCVNQHWSLRMCAQKVEIALKNPETIPQFKACTWCGRGYHKEKITRTTDELCPECSEKRHTLQTTIDHIPPTLDHRPSTVYSIVKRHQPTQLLPTQQLRPVANIDDFRLINIARRDMGLKPLTMEEYYSHKY